MESAFVILLTIVWVVIVVAIAAALLPVNPLLTLIIEVVFTAIFWFVVGLIL